MHDMILIITIAIAFTVLWGHLASLFGSFLRWLANPNNKIGFSYKPLTAFIGYTEVLATGLVVNFFLSQEMENSQKLFSVLAIVGGWFAIKSLNVEPRAEKEKKEDDTPNKKRLNQAEVHYKFILTTFFSLVGGALLGVLIFHLNK